LRSARFIEKHREPEGRGIRVPFLLVPFLWASKEKTLALGGREKNNWF